MIVRRRCSTVVLWALIAVGHAQAQTPPPAPYGPTPNARQIAWASQTPLYAMFCFSLNTYTHKEWGFGDEPVELFTAPQFDAAQIVGAVKAAGCKGLIIVAKHHNGYCLWPSRFNDHYTVKNVPWKNGQGDMVREVVDACRVEGLKVGMYLSPWDRNHAEYGRAEYVTYYHNQLRELLTNYGPLFEIWFDGANGGTGYYGGSGGKREINPDYYEWQVVGEMVRKLQPEAVIFGTAAPYSEVRWNGNERGVSSDPCWATIKEDAPDNVNPHVYLNTGDRAGEHWRPAEADFSLLAHAWFWNPHTSTRSATELVDLYFASIGHNSSMDIGIAPDTRGLLPDRDVQSLKEFGQRIAATFENNLARSATFTASNVRGDDLRYAAANALDGWTANHYWATDDSVLTPELVMEFGKSVTFSVISLREYIALGQRVDQWELDAWRDGAWERFASGTGIGMRRLWRGNPITSMKIRLRITKAAACPAIAEFAAYLEPNSSYKGAELSTSRKSSLDKTHWKIVSASSQGAPATHAIDNNPETLWHTHTKTGRQAPPHELVIDLGATQKIGGFIYLPRQDNVTAGNVSRYAFYLSTDSQHWGKPIIEGEFDNIVASPTQRVVFLNTPTTARYVKFVAITSADGDVICAAEIGVIADKDKP